MFAVWFILFGLGGPAPASYPRAELLVDPESLLMLPEETSFLDTRSEGAFRAGHIPGALSVSASAWSRQFQQSLDPAIWSDLLGSLGLAPDRTVIVYGSNWTETARVWWILRYWGFEKARIMNGPYSLWVAAGGKPSTELLKPARRSITLKPTNRLMVKDEVLECLKNKSVQILDVRSSAEYGGAVGAANKTGCIPGAKNLEWSEFIDSKTQKLKPAKEIQELLRQGAIDTSKPVVTYCQVGARSCVGAFVLEVMGVESVRNYLRGWSEWGNADDTPVAKPHPP
jgi:thiosulfate/3-mercaptopyruvate sulfurtransferase